MKKILYIATGGLHKDGITKSELDSLEHMDLSGLEIHVVAAYCDDTNIISEFEKSNCKVIVLPNRKRKLLKYIIKLKNLIKLEKYDVIHVCGSSSLMIIELLIAYKLKIPKRIAHSHNTLNQHNAVDKMLRPIFYKTYTKAISCGNDAGYFLFKDNKFDVFYNGRDLNKFRFSKEHRKKYREKYNWNNYIIIGHVGRFNEQKNQIFALNLFEKLCKENDKYKLCLVGNGEKFDVIKNEIETRKLKDKVILTDNVNNINELINAFDVMVLPSKYEGLPMVLIEWEANGLFSIVSDKVTTEANVNGSVINLGIDISDENLWINEIKKVKNSDRDREIKSKENISILTNKGFEIKETSKKLRKLYMELEL